MLATSLSAPPVIAFGALLCKETWLLQWHLTAQFVSRLHPHHRQARKSLVAGRASLRLTTAAVCGAIDCALRLQTLFDGYVPALSRHLHKLRCLALSLRCQPATSACYFRLVVAAALLSFLRSAQTVAFLVPPTHRGYAANITSSRHGYSRSPSATLCPPQAPMCGAPMHRLHTGNDGDRFSHSEQPAAHGTEGSANSQTASGF